MSFVVFFFNDTATTEIYTLSLHDALPISRASDRWSAAWCARRCAGSRRCRPTARRSEEHTSELQSLRHLVCRLLLEKKKENYKQHEQKSMQERQNQHSAAQCNTHT